MNVVFDLDGTLIDSAPDIQNMAGSLLSRLGHAPLSLAETRRFIGEGSAVFVQRMMIARNIRYSEEAFESLHSEFLELYQWSVDKAALYSGADDAMQTLLEQGHRLGLCTNKPAAATQAVLEHMHLTPFFSAVIAGGMLPSRKPDPAMLHETITRLGDGPSLFVGDSEIDAETAQRATVPFALFSEGYRKIEVEDIHHDWCFSDFQTLPNIVEQLARG
ncbi:MAG: HAD-IA family hydrolase [Pseudomonadota bacterium]